MDVLFTIRPHEFRLNADVANVRVRWGNFGECYAEISPEAGTVAFNTHTVGITSPILERHGLTTDRVSPGVSRLFATPGTCQEILSWRTIFILYGMASDPLLMLHGGTPA